LTASDAFQQGKGYKSIFVKERRRKVAKALTTDASESQLLLKYAKHRWSGFQSKTTALKLWSCCLMQMYVISISVRGWKASMYSMQMHVGSPCLGLHRRD